jgi:ABC-type transport system involved in multi-copper enzyme maturation permease subunit
MCLWGITQGGKMISLNYILKIFREHFSFFLFTFILVGSFQFLMVMLVVETDVINIAQLFFKNIPLQIQQFLGDDFLAMFSVNRMLAFGYDHPIVIVVMTIMSIMLPGKHIAGEIEAGSMELLYSMPTRRLKLSLSLWLVSALMLLLVIGGGWCGSLIGRTIYPQVANFPSVNIIRIGFNLWLLMLTINSYTFLLSAFSRESGPVTQIAAGITLLFFFLYYIAKLWHKAGFLKPVSIFNYYQPQAIMSDPTLWAGHMMVLAGLTALCLVIALKRINDRDIPG